MQRVKLFIAALTVAGLVLLAPLLGMSELHIDTDLWSNIPGNEILELRFSESDTNTDTSTNKYSYNSDSSPWVEMGYWVEDIPWLGLASETSVLKTNEVNLETSIDADTDFDPLSSFILFRYPDGPLQPFVGIGPTLIINDLGSKKIDSLHHIFMGIHYSF